MYSTNNTVELYKLFFIILSYIYVAELAEEKQKRKVSDTVCIMAKKCHVFIVAQTA